MKIVPGVVGVIAVCGLSAVPVISADLAAGNGEAGAMGAQLERLAARHGFALLGRERIEAEPTKQVQGDLASRIHSLLEDYDYVVVRSGNSGIERVIVVGKKRPYVPPPPPAVPENQVLQTHRKGNLHLVETTLVGKNGEQLQLPLLIDTGASQVVLPSSKAAALGFTLEQLPQRKVQTAKGIVDASVSRLKAVKLGGRAIADVSVAFIDDEFLGGTQILGMNVLGKFRFSIDDEANTLTLEPKQ